MMRKTEMTAESSVRVRKGHGIRISGEKAGEGAMAVSHSARCGRGEVKLRVRRE